MMMMVMIGCDDERARGLVSAFSPRDDIFLLYRERKRRFDDGKPSFFYFSSSSFFSFLCAMSFFLCFLAFRGCATMKQATAWVKSVLTGRPLFCMMWVIWVQKKDNEEELCGCICVEFTSNEAYSCHIKIPQPKPPTRSPISQAQHPVEPLPPLWLGWKGRNTKEREQYEIKEKDMQGRAKN